PQPQYRRRAAAPGGAGHQMGDPGSECPYPLRARRARRRICPAHPDGAGLSERPAEAKAKDGDKIDPLALVGALREAMPADAVYVEETITHAGMLQQHLPWSQPQ